MTPKDFDLAAARTRMRPAAVEGARLVLIEGLSSAEAGRRMRRTGEWARAAAARVRRAYREMMGCPPGWEMVTVPLPADEAEAVRARSSELLHSLPV